MGVRCPVPCLWAVILLQFLSSSLPGYFSVGQEGDAQSVWQDLPSRLPLVWQDLLGVVLGKWERAVGEPVVTSIGVVAASRSCGNGKCVVRIVGITAGPERDIMRDVCFVHLPILALPQSYVPRLGRPDVSCHLSHLT